MNLKANFKQGSSSGMIINGSSQIASRNFMLSKGQNIGIRQKQVVTSRNKDRLFSGTGVKS